jgi:hypothetical protein
MTRADGGGVNAALNLIPFAGIAFLWFIGVIRAQVGSAEDRFVETVFIASVATVGSRTHALPRWLAVIGYLIALVLLLTPPLSNLAHFLFPGWVLTLSFYLLTGRHADRAQGAHETGMRFELIPVC